MNYTEQYIKLLKKVNKSSGTFHIGTSNNNYSDSDKRLLIELINDGYINGKPQYLNKKIHILEISPTVKGRKYLEELEQKELKPKPNTKVRQQTIKKKISNKSSDWHNKPWGKITIGVIIGIIIIVIGIIINHYIKLEKV